RAELRKLRAEREHRRYAGAVHDPARGDDRELYVARHEAHERERAGERLVGIAQVRAAMPAGFAALRDHEVKAKRFEVLGFGDTVLFARDEYVFSFLFSFSFSRKIQKMGRKTLWPVFLEGMEWRRGGGCVGGFHRLGNWKPELLVVTGHRLERAA